MAKKIEYNLERRTSEFGKDVILFCRKLPKDNIINPLWKECQELTLIFGKIVSSLKNSNN
jgi:hypothetical protein